MLRSATLRASATSGVTLAMGDALCQWLSDGTDAGSRRGRGGARAWAWAGGEAGSGERGELGDSAAGVGAPGAPGSARGGTAGSTAVFPGALVPGWLDAGRAARFALIGATLHGPFFLNGFRWVEGAVNARLGAGVSMRTVLAKTALGQVTLFPAYLTAFFAYSAYLEEIFERGTRDLGTIAEAAKSRIASQFGPSFAGGCVFWPCVNVINFGAVPPSGRVAYVAGVGVAWNAFLSWRNALENKAARAASASGQEDR